MNPGRYFVPNMANMGMRVAPMMGVNSMAPRSLGLFGRLGNSIKAFNFSGLLNGANKTLNVVNQTIPLIRQAKPMVNNMKSMVRLAKAFGNETFSSRNNQVRNSVNNNINGNLEKNNLNERVNKQTNLNSSNKNLSNSNKDIINNKEQESSLNDNYPNFFI